jgi:nicotinamidase-related amidase
MQNDFVDGALGSDEAVKIVPLVCEKIKNFDGQIIVTYDTHLEDYMSTLEGEKLPVPHCIKETYGWQLNEKVKEALDGKDYFEIEKPSFGSLDLPEVIRKLSGFEDFEIELLGLCTDICVVSNALILKANFPENRISVDSSCSAGVTVDSHNAALTTMKMCQIDVK